MDNSFLRLKPTFEQAKIIGDPSQSKYRYYDSISLHPNESYLQITNSDVDIVFNGDYNVFLIDCNGSELLDITDKVYIDEFTDNNGIRQIVFEIFEFGKSFSKNVFLKFVHTTGSETFYSNPFVISEDIDSTIRLDYKSYVNFQGTDYLNAPYIQSIRVTGQFEDLNEETENSTYIQSSGNVISKKPTFVFGSAYKFNLLNNFTYRALSIAIKSDIVFVDFKKLTDKVVIKKGQREGNSNLYNADATLHLSDFNYILQYQIIPDFEVVSYYPNGIIPFGENKKISISFNKNVFLGVGKFKIYRENGVLLHTLSESNFTITDNIATAPLLGNYVNINEIGEYYINFDESLFNSNIGQNIDLFEWNFEFLEGEYDSNDYDSNEFLT